MKTSPAPTSGLDDATRTLATFADPVRLRLLSLLSGGPEEVCVCHLHQALGLPQPTVSRHLANLRRNGMVATRKTGLWVHYRLTKPRTPLHKTLLGCLGTSLGDPEIFARDRDRLAAIAGLCDPS